MNRKKRELIDFMNCLGFGIADIKYDNEREMYAHKIIDSEGLSWFPIQSGGSGFEQMFSGSIKRACDDGLDSNK